MNAKGRGAGALLGLLGLPSVGLFCACEFADALDLLRLSCACKSLQGAVCKYVAQARVLVLPEHQDAKLRQSAFSLMQRARCLVQVRVVHYLFPPRPVAAASKETLLRETAIEESRLSRLIADNCRTLSRVDVERMTSPSLLYALGMCTRLTRFSMHIDGVDRSSVGRDQSDLLKRLLASCTALTDLAFLARRGGADYDVHPIVTTHVWPLQRFALEKCTLTSLALVVGRPTPDVLEMLAVLPRQAATLTSLRLSGASARWTTNQSACVDAIAQLTRLESLHTMFFDATFGQRQLPRSLKKLSTGHVGPWVPASLTELDVAGATSLELRATLARCPLLTSLEVQEVPDWVTAPGRVFMLESVWLSPRLQVLHLGSGCVFDGVYLTILANSCRELTTLSATVGGSAREDYVADLLRCPKLQECTLLRPELERKATPWAAAAAEDMARFPTRTARGIRTAVESLTLPSLSAAFASLLDAPSLTDLEVTDSNHLDFDVGVVAALFPALRSLQVTSASIACGPPSQTALAVRPHLRTLGLFAARVDLDAIGSHPLFASVRSLEIADMTSLAHLHVVPSCFPLLAGVGYMDRGADPMLLPVLFMALCMDRPLIQRATSFGSADLCASIAKLLASRS